MRNHNRWLDWKLQHGLAIRGRSDTPLCPKGVIAGLLYRFRFHKFDKKSAKPQVFKQSVGGILGASGDIK